MGKVQYEQKPDEFSLSVTRYEVNLVSHIIYTALNHMPLDDYARKTAQAFMVRMQKSALGNQYSDSKQLAH